MTMQPTKFVLFVTAAVLSVAMLSPGKARATEYILSSSGTNPTAGSGQLSPGTISGSFNYSGGVFSSVTIDIEGVQSTDLNGSYQLGTFTSSNSTNLFLQGITLDNSGGQSNENSFLDISFAAALGGSGDQIGSITAVNGGNPADFTTPPTNAFADPVAVPEPSTLLLFGSVFGLVGLRRWASRGGLLGRPAAVAQE